MPRASKSHPNMTVSTPRLLSRRPRQFAVVAAMCAVLIAGCSSTSDESTAEPTESAAPDVTSEPTEQATTSVPSESVPGVAITSVAEKFLNERENADAYYRKTPQAWLTAVKPLMTPDGWRSLAKSTGDSAGVDYYDFHLNSWQVTVETNCDYSTRPTATAVQLECTVVDTTVDKDGLEVSEAELPGLWVYSGQKLSAQLALKKQNGRWLVHEDLTGSSQDPEGDEGAPVEVGD